MFCNAKSTTIDILCPCHDIYSHTAQPYLKSFYHNFDHDTATNLKSALNRSCDKGKWLDGCGLLLVSLVWVTGCHTFAPVNTSSQKRRDVAARVKGSYC